MFAALLARGYFPRELPPPFRTESLARALRGNARQVFLDSPSPFVALMPAEHSLARAGARRRVLSIPNPILQARIASIIAENWNSIRALTAFSPFSKSVPIHLRKGRAIAPRHTHADLTAIRTRYRFGAKSLVFADVSQYYSTIRTTGIPEQFAVVDKSVRWAQTLAELYQLGQRRPGVGLPIGPDTSHAVAESLMASGDQAIGRTIPADSGFRYVDDFEFGFPTRSHAEDALDCFRNSAGRLGMTLHSEKTRIVSRDEHKEEPWIAELGKFSFRDSPAEQHDDIETYFQSVLAFQATWPNKVVVKFGLARLPRIAVRRENFQIYERCLWDCATREPGALQWVLSEISRYQALGYAISLDKMSEALSQIVADCSVAGHASEVAWALWGAIVFRIRIGSKEAVALRTMNDSVVALLALDAARRGLLDPAESEVWSQSLTVDSLFSNRWLLSYEAAVRGWLHPAKANDFIAAAPAFKFLREQGVNFYDVAVPLEVALPIGLASGRPSDEADALSPA